MELIVVLICQKDFQLIGRLPDWTGDNFMWGSIQLNFNFEPTTSWWSPENLYAFADPEDWNQNRENTNQACHNWRQRWGEISLKVGWLKIDIKISKHPTNCKHECISVIYMQLDWSKLTGQFLSLVSHLQPRGVQCYLSGHEVSCPPHCLFGTRISFRMNSSSRTCEIMPSINKFPESKTSTWLIKELHHPQTGLSSMPPSMPGRLARRQSQPEWPGGCHEMPEINPSGRNEAAF